jgi:adenylosuccinate synthase
MFSSPEGRPRPTTGFGPFITDVSGEANLAVDRGKKVLVEGTQGSGLSLYHSPHYPKTTSRETNAAGFVSEVGLSPLVITEIVLVFRTFPIRVAGAQAGPLHEELQWEQLQAESGSPLPLHEYTSVTHKLRRLGRFDWESARRAVLLNRPTKIAANFLDYLDFQNREAREWPDLTPSARAFVSRLEEACIAPAFCLGIGPRLSETIRRTSLDGLPGFADPNCIPASLNTRGQQ